MRSTPASKAAGRTRRRLLQDKTSADCQRNLRMSIDLDPYSVSCGTSLESPEASFKRREARP
jgi:hypothetical protein